MRHRQSTTVRSRVQSLLRPLGVFALAAALGSTLLAAAGGAAKRDVGLDVVQIARQQVGDAYLWGGNGPDAWDCSGLAARLWREVGGVAGIPRVSRDQQAWAVPIPREQLLPGDLVFFGHPVHHMGIYAGDGLMIDASSARKGVLERPIFRDRVIRYGRVPRANMPAVAPWTPPPPPTPSPSPSATASPASTASTAARPTVSPSASTPARVTPTPSASPTALTAAAVLTPLRGLPSPELGAPHSLADRAARNARTVTGSRHWTDTALVTVAWKHAGGPQLPATRAGIEQAGTPVALDKVRRGDVVIYGKPAGHVAIYLGHGYMIGASKSAGRVVVRRVFSSPTVRFVRLPQF